MCGRPAVVMTDVCPCPRVSPSPCLSSTQVHVGVTPAELSPPIYCFLVALPAPPPIIPCHILPHLSLSLLAKYTLVLVTRWPSPSTLTQPPLSHALTYFAPSSSSFSSFLSSSCFLPFPPPSVLQLSPGSLCYPHFNSPQDYSLHMQHFEQLQDISYSLTARLCIARHLPSSSPGLSQCVLPLTLFITALSLHQP